MLVRLSQRSGHEDHSSKAAMERSELTGSLRIPSDVKDQDGWVVLIADCGQAGRPGLAFHVLVRH